MEGPGEAARLRRRRPKRWSPWGRAVTSLGCGVSVHLIKSCLPLTLVVCLQANYLNSLRIRFLSVNGVTTVPVP